LLHVLQLVTQLAQGLQCSQEAVLWCKQRAARAGGRAAALVPALQELERAVLAPGQGVEVRLVESVSMMLVLLAKVCPLLVPAVGVGGVALPWSWCRWHSRQNRALRTMHSTASQSQHNTACQ
jgi:hypothetical protein